MKQTMICLLVCAGFFISISGKTQDPSSARGVWLYDASNDLTNKVKTGNSQSILRDSLLYNISDFYYPSTQTLNPTKKHVLTNSNLRGAMIFVAWNMIQNPDANPPAGNTNCGSETTYYFDKLDAELVLASRNSNLKGIGLMLWTGQKSPVSWTDKSTGQAVYKFGWLAKAGSNDGFTDHAVMVKVVKGGEVDFYPDYMGFVKKDISSAIDWTQQDIDQRYNPSLYPDGSSTAVLGGRLGDAGWGGYGSTTTGEGWGESPYEKRWYKMIDALLDHLAHFPSGNALYNCDGTPINDDEGHQIVIGATDMTSLASKLLFIQSAEGTTGDLFAWHDDSDGDDFEGDLCVDLNDNGQLDANEEFTKSNDYTYKIKKSSTSTSNVDDWKMFIKKSWGYMAERVDHYNKVVSNTNIMQHLHLLLNGGSTALMWPNAGLDGNAPDISSLSAPPGTSTLFDWVTVKAPTQAQLNNLNKNPYNNQSNAFHAVMINAWRKAPEAGHLYQLNFEPYYQKAYDKLRKGTLYGTTNYAIDSPMFYRDELGWEHNGLNECSVVGTNATITDAQVKHVLAAACSALHFGLDFWVVQKQQLFKPVIGTVDGVDKCIWTQTLDESDINMMAFKFFNNHANDRAGVSSSAFSALKEGIDASGKSTTGFSCSQTGSVTSAVGSTCGKEFCTWLAATHLSNSAQQKIPLKGQGGPHHQYDEKDDAVSGSTAGTNDVGWYIYGKATQPSVASSNYEQGMNEITTSVDNGVTYNAAPLGYYNQFDIYKSIYGRFSKAIVDQATYNSQGSNRTKEYLFGFNISSQLMQKASDNSYSNEYIAVTYFDDGSTISNTKKWKIEFPCTIGFNTNIFPEVVKSGGNKWKTVVFANASSVTSSVFTITNTSSVTDITKFALVEVFFGNSISACPYTAGGNVTFINANAVACGGGGGGTGGFTGSTGSGTSGALKSRIDINGHSLLSINPNPVDGSKFSIALSNGLMQHLEIFNEIGEIVYNNAPATGKVSINKQQMKDGGKAGVYFVKVIDDNGDVLTGKLIIQ